MLTSWSEQLTPATLSMASVLIRPPVPSGPPRTVDPHRIARPVAHLGVRLPGRLHVGPDAAVVEQVHRGAQDRRDQLVRRQARRVDAERLPDLRRDTDRLGGTGVDAAALADRIGAVV